MGLIRILSWRLTVALLAITAPGSAGAAWAAEPDPTYPDGDAATEMAPGEATPAEPVAAEPVAPPEPVALPPGHPPIRGATRPGISLPGDIRLNGRFDLAFEVHSYTDDPTEGDTALRNHHRFVFLSRHSRHDPFFFNAELLGLTFYEIGARVPNDRDDPWRLAFALGKVMVPFGADPLYHHAYGGRVGIDQRFIPIVWAELGVKGTVDVEIEPVSVRLDAYLVRGLALRSADGVLNIQTHGAPLDDLNFAGGVRLSASLGPATIHYSLYASGLNFERTLVMQALDVGLWRIPGIPVIEDLAVTAGVVRADVSGGDEPSYYHFADYLQVRYYALDTLYVQYRAGLDMRDNRSGVFADASRLDRNDTSAHSVSVGWVPGGFSLIAQHIWQLELVDEQKDDMFRLIATYEF